MAKVVLTIEDLPGGKVSCKAEPNFLTMMKMNLSGHELTGAHGYALTAINAIRQESKKASGRIIVGVPRLK